MTKSFCVQLTFLFTFVVASSIHISCFGLKEDGKNKDVGQIKLELAFLAKAHANLGAQCAALSRERRLKCPDKNNSSACRALRGKQRGVCNKASRQRANIKSRCLNAQKAARRSCTRAAFQGKFPLSKTKNCIATKVRRAGC